MHEQSSQALVDKYETAIRKHRDQRGDDRCWMDDEELYRSLPEGYEPPAREVAVELELCRKFIACRSNPATEYVSPQREIDRLRGLLFEAADMLADEIAGPRSQASMTHLADRIRSTIKGD